MKRSNFLESLFHALGCVRPRGPGHSSPGPLDFPFLALLLLLAPREVVRDPPCRIRDPAYRVRHPAYRSLGGRFEHADFELLHARYRSAGGLRSPLANRDHRFVGSSQHFLALPEGYALQLSALPANEGYEALE